MDEIFADFRAAQTIGSGPLLSTTLIPIAPPTSPNRLYAFSRSTNPFSVGPDIRAQILYNQDASFRLSKAEGNAWIDVYVAYWKAIKELLAAEDADVRSRSDDGVWAKVYEAWKEMTNALIRGYSNGGFQAWTVPCLYVAGKYLRAFAIKADERAREKKGNVTFNAGFQDDIVGDYGKNDKLEDAARLINRIFTLCISDRYVESSLSQAYKTGD